MMQAEEAGLTDRERRAFLAIRDTIETTGVCPSLREIAEGAGLRSRSGIHYVVRHLVQKGYIVRLKSGPGSQHMLAVAPQYRRQVTVNVDDLKLVLSELEPHLGYDSELVGDAASRLAAAAGLS